jgi:hypothetical protein
VNREWRKSSFSDHNGSCVEVLGDLAMLRDGKDPAWRKATFSGAQNDCVEVYRHLNELRDTKQRSGPTLRVDVARLAAYVRATA